MLVLEMDRNGIAYPGSVEEFEQTPDWAKPIVMAALQARQ